MYGVPDLGEEMADMLRDPTKLIALLAVLVAASVVVTVWAVPKSTGSGVVLELSKMLEENQAKFNKARLEGDGDPEELPFSDIRMAGWGEANGIAELALNTLSREGATYRFPAWLPYLAMANLALALLLAVCSQGVRRDGKTEAEAQ